MNRLVGWIQGHGVLSSVIALVIGIAIGGSTVPEEEPRPVAESATPTPSEVAEPPDEPEPEPEPEPPELPDPDGTYTSSCDYLLGDFTESPGGFRFVADARLKNTGNVGIIARVTATWDLAGGDAIREQKQVRVPFGRSKRIGFIHVATSDQIDRHQSLSYGENCKVRVRIVDSFGSVN